jgi:hypothetical protein
MNRALLLACSLVCLSFACETGAQTKADSAPLISIDIKASRPKLVAGDGISIEGTIENVSNQVVYLRESSSTMTLPMELEGRNSSVYGYAAFFPTEPHIADGRSYESYFSNVIALKPGDHYVMLWTSGAFAPEDSRSSFVWRQVREQFQYLFFYPGEYRIIVATKYWTDPELPAAEYRTLTRSATVTVGAPLFVILLGAALGGLIAYIIGPGRESRATSRMPAWAEKVFRHSVGIGGAMLLSVIVTIMLSRISETQFILSVSVNDIWGAVVIGFAAQWAGKRLIDRWLKSPDRNAAAGQEAARTASRSAPASAPPTPASLPAPATPPTPATA